MFKKKGKIEKFRRKYIPLVCLAFASSSLAAAPSTQISLNDILNTFRKTSNHAAVSVQILRDKSDAATDAYLSERRAWKADFDYEQKNGEEKEKTAGGGLSRSILLGPSTSAIQSSATLSAEAEHLERLQTVRELELSLAQTFLDVLKSMRAQESAQAALDYLSTYMESASHAAKLGGLAHLAFRRSQIFYQALLAERDLAQERKAKAVGILQRLNVLPAGLQATKVSNQAFQDLKMYVNEVLKEQPSLGTLAIKKRQEAAAQDALNSRNRREIELKVGWSKIWTIDDKKGQNSVQVGLGIPLDGGLVGSSQAREAEADARAAEAALAIRSASEQTEFQRHQARLSLALSQIEIAGRRLDRSESLLLDSIKGLKSGQIEFVEVVESLKDYYDSRKAVTEANSERDDSILQLMNLTNSGVFALRSPQ